jgi:hypothetical protein
MLIAAWMDNSSETTAKMRARTPWSAWLALRGKSSDYSRPPAFYLLVYSWDNRALHVIQMPETGAAVKSYTSTLRKTTWSAEAAAPAADRALAQFYGQQVNEWVQPRLCLRWFSEMTDPQDLEQVRTWILTWPRTLRFWLELPREVRISWRRGNPRPNAYDSAVLAREAFQLNAHRLRLHILPQFRDRATFFSRLNTPPPTDFGPNALTVAILNASGEPGVALQATKVLRWRGLDVVDFRNAPSRSLLTRFIDRTSSYSEAASVARTLGCEEPEIMDEMDLSRRERVTVLLGQDYKGCASLQGAAQTVD